LTEKSANETNNNHNNKIPKKLLFLHLTPSFVLKMVIWPMEATMIGFGLPNDWLPERGLIPFSQLYYFFGISPWLNLAQHILLRNHRARSENAV